MTMSTEERAADLAANQEAVANVSDADLYSAAKADEAVEAPVNEGQPEAEHKADATGRLHAPDGKFAPKAKDADAAPTQQPEQTEAKDDGGQVPSWRLREVREESERRVQEAERRLHDDRLQWQRHVQELQARVPQQPVQRPDLYENPDAFVEHGVRQAVDPIKSEIGQLREFYSRRDANREHGQEKVKAAFDAIEQGLARRDPDAIASYSRVMQSMDPYGDLVNWHQQKTVYSQIGSDPQAWFEKQFQERLKDPTFQGKVIEHIRGSANGQQNGSSPKVVLPPSLNKVAAAARVTGDEDGDLSDASLFRHATR